MSAVIVRYRVKPSCAAENADLVRAVYTELATQQPPGFRYATFVMDDGVTFIHVAFTETGHTVPLPDLPAFQHFVSAIAERCDEPPQTTQLSEEVGSYRL